MPEKNYADPETMRNELESYIAAGASNETMLSELPLHDRGTLLNVIRLLKDELDDYRERVPILQRAANVLAKM